VTRTVLDLGTGMQLAEILGAFFKAPERRDGEVPVHMVYDEIKRVPIGDSSDISSLENSPVKGKAVARRVQAKNASVKTKQEPDVPEGPSAPTLKIVSIITLCIMILELISFEKQEPHSPIVVKKGPHKRTNSKIDPGSPGEEAIETLDLTTTDIRHMVIPSRALASPGRRSQSSSPPPLEDVLPTTAGKGPAAEDTKAGGRTTRSRAKPGKGKTPAAKKQKKRKGELEQLLESGAQK
jgi:hypothetical protein